VVYQSAAAVVSRLFVTEFVSVLGGSPSTSKLLASSKNAKGDIEFNYGRSYLDVCAAMYIVRFTSSGW